MAVVGRRSQVIAESECYLDSYDDTEERGFLSAGWVFASFLAAGSLWWCCRRSRRAQAQVATRTLDLPSGLRVRLP